MIRLARPALDAIVREAARSTDGRETGGILFGHDHGDYLEVTMSGGPGPDAIRQSQRFLRDLQYSRALAERAYRRDGSVWIGEWHTHPNGEAEPSSIDLSTCAQHLSNPELGFARFLTAIVTPCPNHGWDDVTIIPWLVETNTATLVLIEIFEVTPDD